MTSSRHIINPRLVGGVVLAAVVVVIVVAVMAVMMVMVVVMVVVVYALVAHVELLSWIVVAVGLSRIGVFLWLYRGGKGKDKGARR